MSEVHTHRLVLLTPEPDVRSKAVGWRQYAPDGEPVLQVPLVMAPVPYPTARNLYQAGWTRVSGAVRVRAHHMGVLITLYHWVFERGGSLTTSNHLARERAIQSPFPPNPETGAEDG